MYETHFCEGCRYESQFGNDHCEGCQTVVGNYPTKYVGMDKTGNPIDIYCEGKKQVFVDGILMDDPNDPVNHPFHYTKGKIEVADFIADQKLNFDRGNAVKYVCRAGSKDPTKEIQDLEKAIWYINHEIKTLKGETENAAKKEV